MNDNNKPAKKQKPVAKKAQPSKSAAKKTPAKKQTVIKRTKPLPKTVDPTPDTHSSVVRVNDVKKKTLRQRMLEWFKSR